MARQRRVTGSPQVIQQVAPVGAIVTIKIVDGLFGLGKILIPWAALVAIAAFGHASIRDIAGTRTEFSAVVRAAVDMQLTEKASWGLSVVLGAGWFRERRLRRRTIAHHAAYIQKLEQRLDPNRTTSALTRTGAPRPEDLRNG